MTTLELIQKANSSKSSISELDSEKKNRVLLSMADAIDRNRTRILKANRLDVERARESMSTVMLDRLALTDQRIDSMIDGIHDVVNLPDPCGEILSETVRPDGLVIRKISVPIGVIAIIYESRPNVTSDAAALSIKAGSPCILRGGKEAHLSSEEIVHAMKEGLIHAGACPDAIQIVEDTTRQSARELMEAKGGIDLLIPRGGKGLISFCLNHSKVPVIETGTGICHIYVDRDADFNMALNIIENAKCSRPSVCNAVEVCLVDRTIAARFLPKLSKRLRDDRISVGKQPVELRLDRQAAEIISGAEASEADFDTEFLDYVMAVGIVDGVHNAIKHIERHSTGHSDAIITSDEKTADLFVRDVDSAAVYVNASTRFTDGGEFGLGCEMGISTQKLHARGPMGLRELCTYKYVLRGSGQIR